jgi:hypothetical protein
MQMQTETRILKKSCKNRTHLEHRRRVGEEQRHAIGHVVLDFGLSLSRALVDAAAVVGEVILDGWVLHLRIIESASETREQTHKQTKKSSNQQNKQANKQSIK